MQRKKLLGLYGLKWNPFTPDVPNEGLYTTARIESFVRRIETMVHDGGFALITGEPGYGKSIALRIIEEQLAELPDVSVGVLARPQSGVADFYRELGDLFGLELRPHNRWAGFKTLRERWKAHADASLLKPVLLIDEAQDMLSSVLSELRILSSGKFDAETYLTVVLAGDTRLADRFRHPELLPIGSRIRTRLVLDYASQDELRDVLRHALKKAGAPNLLTENLQEVLIDHAAGNYRVLMTMAGELLMAACERELPVIDEKLYLELFEERSTGRRAKNRRTKG
ncbi:MAG: AAA family ATPase [Nitrospira sp.]|nr:AAA family ATPase [Nitrospira sp.]